MNTREAGGQYMAKTSEGEFLIVEAVSHLDAKRWWRLACRKIVGIRKLRERLRNTCGFELQSDRAQIWNSLGKDKI
jgi:hypothetical protein